MVTAKTSLNKRDLLLLLVWLFIGLILRFNNLADKPASSIEIATLGFSLGHGFNQIPLNELIPIDTLLSPLIVDNAIDTTDVIDRLFAESTHPPLYFCLTHWWIKLFVENGELVSLQVGRSLSAILGGLAIPAMFGFGWLAWRNSLAAHFAAILMAVSPYGIYLAQEARHYTLSILWIIASLSCMVVAINRLSRRQRISWLLVFVWIVVNALGMATHYFFSLALALEGFVVVGFWFEQNRNKNRLSLNYWLPIVVVGLGSLAGCLVWLPVASGISDSELTDWIDTSYDSDEVWLPLPRILAWLITMVAMLPVEGTSLGVTIASGVIILMGMIWTMPQLIITWRSFLAKPNLVTPKLFTCFMVGAAILYLCLIYGYGKDVSLAARYHFVYFPVILIILAAIVAQLWQPSGTKIIVIAIVTIGLLGSLTVTEDLGFRKSRRANNMAQQIQQVHQNPTIVATTYDSHSQLREAIALGLAVENNNSTKESNLPNFLILERNDNSTNRLQEIISSQPKPLNLWSINLKIYNSYLSRIGCSERRQYKLDDSGYRNRFYNCYN